MSSAPSASSSPASWHRQADVESDMRERLLESPVGSGTVDAPLHVDMSSPHFSSPPPRHDLPRSQPPRSARPPRASPPLEEGSRGSSRASSPSRPGGKQPRRSSSRPSSRTGSPSRPAPARKPYMPKRSDPQYQRLKYFRRLTPRGEDAGLVAPPAHIVPRSLWGLPPVQPGVKQSSMTTVFTIWNTMMGSSLLAVPWGFSQSGALLGLGLVFGIGLICWYTCTLIAHHGRPYVDFFDLCRDVLGRWGEVVCWVSSLLVLFGAVLVYDRLMADSLHDSVNGFRTFASSSAAPTAKGWGPDWAPIYILLVIVPLSNIRDFSIFVRLNTFGLMCAVYLMTFILYTSLIEERVKPRFVASHEIEPSTAAHLAGILPLSFFIHNCILPIVKNGDPAKTQRDIGIGFALAALSYALIGGAAYCAYGAVTEIPQDFLRIYDTTKVSAVIARLALLLQLFSVCPLLLFILRIQFFGFLWQTQEPDRLPVFLLNMVVLGVATTVSVVYPHVGDLLRYTGSICGLLYVFFLPIAVHLKKQYDETGSRFGDMKLSIVFHVALLLVGVGTVIGQFV